jgi:hypothetical protein
LHEKQIVAHKSSIKKLNKRGPNVDPWNIPGSMETPKITLKGDKEKENFGDNNFGSK